jgi:ABC-2 type transport system ATP-binding protein
MIEIKNVSKSYKKGKKVIDDLNLKINNGEIFGFIGLNGAGKTTTIKMLTGILEIDEGEILIDGKSIFTDAVEAKKNIGLVPDNPDIFLKFKGIEYLNFIADVYEVDEEERVKEIEKYAKEFSMEEELENKIESYSHGMRQKIHIIGALLHKPNNWILDEPITGLDPKASYDLKKIMKDYANEGRTVFFSTHILEIAEKLCDRIGIINKGKLVFVGTLEEMRKEFGQKLSLEEMFLEVTENEE